MVTIFYRSMLVICMLAVAAPSAAETSTAARFFYSGDGIIHLTSEKNGRTFHGRFRQADGQYRTAALDAITRVFGAPADASRQVISLRLIEYLDFLEDRLNPGALMTITSGYRAPQYNAGLRKRGALAAKASLHQYGMAVDLVMQGVASKRVWETVREVGFGGTGYYHGRTVHVDVGPARFWDEKTSGVGTGLSDDNKLIGIVSDFDVYAPGDPIVLRFIRMTAFPIGVQSRFSLVAVDGSADNANSALPFAVDRPEPSDSGCTAFGDIDQMAAFRWRLPVDTRPGGYRIQAGFCGNRWPDMPPTVVTPAFAVHRP